MKNSIWNGSRELMLRCNVHKGDVEIITVYSEGYKKVILGLVGNDITRNQSRGDIDSENFIPFSDDIYFTNVPLFDSSCVGTRELGRVERGKTSKGPNTSGVQYISALRNLLSDNESLIPRDVQSMFYNTSYLIRIINQLPKNAQMVLLDFSGELIEDYNELFSLYFAPNEGEFAILRTSFERHIKAFFEYESLIQNHKDIPDQDKETVSIFSQEYIKLCRFAIDKIERLQGGSTLSRKYYVRK